MFTDDDAAALYDAMSPWDDTHPESAFINQRVMAAEAVLDVGCGTGSLLYRTRDHGHTGRLVGLDPDKSMLNRARRRTDIEWVEGKAADVTWDREFDLVPMTSNAFQCLIRDEELRASLKAIHDSLREGGRFVFGTRHVQDRAWERWNPSNAFNVEDLDGRPLRMWHEIESVAGNVVTMTETTGERDGTVLHAGRGTLRFHDVPGLNAFLEEAGFEVEEQYGGWERGPVTETSQEIITVARRVS